MNMLRKMKEITPFSNSSESESWKYNNCYQCRRYSSKVVHRKNARCKLAYDLDYSYGTGFISLETAEKIGYTKPFLNTRCNEFNKPLPKKSKQIENQKELFND